jgi:hypothetical protein
MQKLTLSEANVTDILEQSIAPKIPVVLVALDYNWGPPVSGRFDTDFVQIWAAARQDLRPRELKLLMKPYSQPELWTEELTFKHVSNQTAHGLYFLELSFAVLEFVIKLYTEDEQVFCDNNGGFGVNYRLTPYSGRGTTAVAGEGAIWNLKEITPVSLLWRRRG